MGTVLQKDLTLFCSLLKLILESPRLMHGGSELASSMPWRAFWCLESRGRIPPRPFPSVLWLAHNERYFLGEPTLVEPVRLPLAGGRVILCMTFVYCSAA
jgi:hypothetical protein